MWPLGVVVLQILPAEIVDMLGPAGNKVVRAFELNRLNEPPDIGVHVRRPASGNYQADLLPLHHFVEVLGVSAIVVVGHRSQLQTDDLARSKLISAYKIQRPFKSEIP